MERWVEREFMIVDMTTKKLLEFAWPRPNIYVGDGLLTRGVDDFPLPVWLNESPHSSRSEHLGFLFVTHSNAPVSVLRVFLFACLYVHIAS